MTSSWRWWWWLNRHPNPFIWKIERNTLFNNIASSFHQVITSHGINLVIPKYFGLSTRMDNTFQYPKLIMPIVETITHNFFLHFCPLDCTMASNETKTTGGDAYVRFQWAYYQIRKIKGCTCAGDAGKVFPAIDRKPLVSHPGMHHGTYVTHVLWCMLGSCTRGGVENVPAIPGAYATHNFTYLERGLLAGIIFTLVVPKIENGLLLQYKVSF